MGSLGREDYTDTSSKCCIERQKENQVKARDKKK